MLKFKTRWMSVFATLSMISLTGLAADKPVPVNVAGYTNVIKLECAGDSITAGFHVAPEAAYPVQLGRLLGPKWEVHAVGRSGTTLLNKGSMPYQKGPFGKVLARNPDVVLIMLGTNDSNTKNWVHKDEFEADYKGMIEKLAALPSKPRIYICNPPPVLRTGLYGCSEANILEEIKMIENVAKEMKVDVIDVHGALKARESENLQPDNIHPNAAGSTVIAATVYEALTGSKPTDEMLKAALPPQAEQPAPAKAGRGKKKQKNAE